MTATIVGDAARSSHEEAAAGLLFRALIAIVLEPNAYRRRMLADRACREAQRLAARPGQ